MSHSKPYSLIRFRKTHHPHHQHQNDPLLLLARSTHLRNSHHQPNPQLAQHSPPKTQLLKNPQPNPQLILTSQRSHLNSRLQKPKPKNPTFKPQTHLQNSRYLDNHRTTFRVKNITSHFSPIKSSFSSVLTPKAKPTFENLKSVPNFDEPTENETQKLNYQSTRLREGKSLKRFREERCLIVSTKKLPFSLERKSTKRRFTERTNFTTNGEIFELDISTILDENEPETPFMRRDSGLDAIVNMG